MANNNRGFTLAELLAVIVVLAIIIVLLMPGVMTTMETSRQKGFRMFAQRVANAAREKFSVDDMMGTTTAGTMCYDLAKLGLDKHGSYQGKIEVTVSANLKAEAYTITLSDRSYSITGVNVSTIDDAPLQAPKLGHASLKCP